MSTIKSLFALLLISGLSYNVFSNETFYTFKETDLEPPPVKFGTEQYLLRLLEKYQKSVYKNVSIVYKDLQIKKDGFFSFLRGWNEFAWGSITKYHDTDQVTIWFTIPSANIKGSLEGNFHSLNLFQKSHLTLWYDDRIIREYYTIPANDNFVIGEWDVILQMGFPNNCLQFGILACDRSRRCFTSMYTIYCEYDL